MLVHFRRIFPRWSYLKIIKFRLAHKTVHGTRNFLTFSEFTNSSKICAYLKIDPLKKAMHFRLFREKLLKWELLTHLPDQQRHSIMANIETLILATNMDHHERILNEWRALTNFSLSSSKCRMALMKYVLKFCLKLINNVRYK